MSTDKLLCAECGGDFSGGPEAMFRDFKQQLVCPFCVAFQILAHCGCYACGSHELVNALLLTEIENRFVPVPLCVDCLKETVERGPLGTKTVEVIGGAVIADGGVA